MSGRFLLDTNVVIALFNGDKKIIKWLDRANEVFLPYIVIGELYYGSLKSKLKKNNIGKIEEFIQSVPVITPNLETARTYGLALSSFDSHFQYVDGISLKFFR